MWTDTVADNRCSIVKGTFDNTGVEDGWADLIIIAQVSNTINIRAESGVHLSDIWAFHWCPDYGKASAEFGRILKKDGAVVFVWNLEDRFVSVTFFVSILLTALKRWCRLGCTTP